MYNAGFEKTNFLRRLKFVENLNTAFLGDFKLIKVEYKSINRSVEEMYFWGYVLRAN